MLEHELDTLRQLYRNGLYNAPFYRNRISGEEVFDSYEQFRTIPFMYKEELRTTGAYERTAVKAGDVYGIFSSSGTSGEKTYYVYSKKDKEVHEEFVNTFYSELGIESTDLGGVFAPVDTGVMAHTMMWQFTTRGAGYVNCPEPSPKEMIRVIQSLPVTVIATRPSVVCTIADNPEYVRIAQNSTVKKMILGGGFLSDERRKLIEKIWNADCYNMFGMSEMFGPMAGECRQKDGQHYLNKYLLIEILDPKTNAPVLPGEIGMAVYTSLWDKGFPLLRYWTDDLMSVDTSPCKCGRNLPRIRYRGRLADCICIDGQYVFPEMLENCLMKHGFMMEYRAHLREDGSVLVSVEKMEHQTACSEMEKEIIDIFRTKVDMNYVSAGALAYDGHQPRFTTSVEK